MWGISTAVVVDDALGPPGHGELSPEDKNTWVDFVSTDADVQALLLATFAGAGAADLDDLLATLTSQIEHIQVLWKHHRENTLVAARLDLLFHTFSLNWNGKANKPLLVHSALVGMIGTQHVQAFWRMEDALEAVSQADVAFIDFFLDDNESVDVALQRIRNYREALKSAKLLFIMSSRADINTQQKVRQIVGTRTAFFEVMRKIDVESAWVTEKILAKGNTYLANRALESVARELVTATRAAADEFEEQCNTLEIHDLRLFNLARLAEERESIAAYLTWLASESIAAKVRRISASAIQDTAIDADDIGFTGQIEQGRVLFDLFSEVVFGLPPREGSPIRFGEVLVPRMVRRPMQPAPAEDTRHQARRASALSRRSPSRAALSARSALAQKRLQRAGGQTAFAPALTSQRFQEDARYLLVLTPACDLARCSPTKMVLCVEGTAQDMSDARVQAREKLYGKHENGLRHLLKIDGPKSPVLITWHKDRTLSIPARDLMGGGFRRLAQMNELYAHEVKEEVLRDLGRVGTQIDPPPAFALHATLKWKVGTVAHEASTDTESFLSAVLSYSEQARKRHPTVVLSDEFKKWASTGITESLAGQAPSAKLKKYMTQLDQAPQFVLKSGLTYRDNDFVVRVEDDSNQQSPGNLLLEVILSTKVGG